MKKLILVLSVLILAYVSQAQGVGYGYTYVAQRYNWLAGVFNALGLPAGDSPAFQPGQLQRAGALYYDSTGIDSGLYVWSGLVWYKAGTGGGSSTVYVNAPLTMDGDTIEIAEASIINDGYLSAAKFEKFDSLRNDWWRNVNRLYTANTSDSVFIGATSPVTPHVMNISGNMYFHGKMYYTTANRRLFDAIAGQNLFVGGRSGNETYTAVESTGIGELSLGSISNNSYNTAVGKGSGFAIIAPGVGNNVFGRNALATGSVTGSYNVINAYNGDTPVSRDSSYQMNLGNQILGHRSRFLIGLLNNSAAITQSSVYDPTAIWDIDSLGDGTNTYAHLRLRDMGADPTVINNGNVWHAGGHIYGRIGGVTFELCHQSAGSGGFFTPDQTSTANTSHDLDGNTFAIMDGAVTRFGLFTGNTNIKSPDGNTNINIANGNIQVENLPRATTMTDRTVMVWDTLSADWHQILASNLGIAGGGETIQDILTNGNIATGLNMDFVNGSMSFTGTGYGLIFNNGGGNSVYLLAGGTDAMRFVQDAGVNYVDLDNSLLSAARNQKFPDKSGTFAMTSDLPSVGTYSTRIGLSPVNGTEFFQTDAARDAPPGKYYYINSKWNYVPIAEERLAYDFQDFNSIGAANTIIGSYVLTATGSITASSPGAARFSTAASGTGRAVIYHGSNGVSNAWWHADNGAMYVKVLLRDLTQLSTASEEFILRVGVTSQTAGSEPVDGAYLMYDRLTSTNWIMVNAQNTGGANRTETASSTAVTTGAHTLEIFCSGTGGSTEYWVDGTSLGTISTHIPNNFVFPSIQLVKSAGTTPVTVDVDYIKSWLYLTTQRN